MTFRVYVDFDGTIAPDDPTDNLFERFADPEWKVIEAEWQAGHLASWETMQRQVQLLDVAPETLDEFVSTMRVDPAFPAFVDLCRSYDAEVLVVSDGFDRVIARVLETAGLDLPFAANRLEPVGDGRWRLKFPFRRFDCATRMGNCKCSHQRGQASARQVMVGDGRSDFCIAERCDFVLAKGRLAEHCVAKGLDHAPMASFADATPVLAEWLARVEAQEHGLRVGRTRRRV